MRKSAKAWAAVGIVCVALLSSSMDAVATAGPAAPAGLAETVGYWLVTPHGAVFPYGSASTLYGPASTINGLQAPIVGVAATIDRKGYWMVGADGGVFAFGDAKFYGSLGGLKLHAPISAIAVSASGHGTGCWARTAASSRLVTRGSSEPSASPRRSRPGSASQRRPPGSGTAS